MAETQSPVSIVFKVNRFAPELVVPAKPTPYEFKALSDLDCRLRMQVPTLFIYPHNPSMNGVDLAKLMKNAISQALVFFEQQLNNILKGLPLSGVVDYNVAKSKL